MFNCIIDFDLLHYNKIIRLLAVTLSFSVYIFIYYSLMFIVTWRLIFLYVFLLTKYYSDHIIMFRREKEIKKILEIVQNKNRIHLLTATTLNYVILWKLHVISVGFIDFFIFLLKWYRFPIIGLFVFLYIKLRFFVMHAKGSSSETNLFVIAILFPILESSKDTSDLMRGNDGNDEKTFVLVHIFYVILWAHTTCYILWCYTNIRSFTQKRTNINVFPLFSRIKPLEEFNNFLWIYCYSLS